MAYEYQPGMKFYQAIWERGGECVGTWSMHAANEADVLSEAESFFAEHPEHGFPREGTTVRVCIVSRAGDFKKSLMPDQGLRGWRFTVEELSPLHWLVEGLCEDGRSVSREGGPDEMALLAQCVEDARNLPGRRPT
jgi:hypothetical protein